MRKTGKSEISIAAGILVLGIATPLNARADTLFHVSEVIAEQEISPRIERHVHRWEGFFYVNEAGVSESGFGKKGGDAIRFDEPKIISTLYEKFKFVRTVHRIPNGIEVTSEYGSYSIHRVIRQTGPATCEDQVSATLKPGHQYFEDFRMKTFEPMLMSTETYLSSQCDFPRMSSWTEPSSKSTVPFRA